MHPGYSLTRPRTPETAEEARRLARTALDGWGLDVDAVDSAALLLSELVSNAVRHAHGGAVRVLVLRPGPDRVRVAVVDRAAAKLPQLRTPTFDAVDGRGLLLVSELADRWGYDLLWAGGSRPWGKRVWAELKVST